MEAAMKFVTTTLRGLRNKSHRVISNASLFMIK